MPVLTFVDILGIQSFVFATNRLKDVVGGSELVYQATSHEGWVSQFGYQTNMIVGAGGNLLLRFDTSDQAKNFAAEYSRKLLDEAPELEGALVHHEYSHGQLAQAIRAIQVKMERHKFERCPSVPLLGLGVTATCQETQRPALALDAAGMPIAKGVAARRKDKHQTPKRWRKFLPSDCRAFHANNVEFVFPRELDDLGRSHGDTSLMGVVHIDGNGIGQKLKIWLQERYDSDDETIVAEYRQLSTKLDHLAEKVFKDLVQRIIVAIQKQEQSGYSLYSATLKKSFALHCEKDQATGKLLLFLPIRPILLGGDDFTFVCDGRIALDLATAALTGFEQASTLPHIGSVRACAGVALVKTHAPFARAYGLAASLCTSAKEWLQKNHNRQDQSALDWHIGLVSPTETLATLRQRQYNVSETGQNELTCRPYPLCQYQQVPFDPNWNWLAKQVLGTTGKGFQTSSPDTANWQAHRSKLKRLRELAREDSGDVRVREALAAWQIAHPRLELPNKMENGFVEGRTPLLDALELLDLHFPLEQ